MKHEDMGGFEGRLLTELTEVVRERGEARPRRGLFTMPRLALGGAALAAVAAAALVVPALNGPGGGTPKPGTDTAAAAQPDPSAGGEGVPHEPVGYSIAVDGDEVELVVGSLEDEKGLEADLRKEGISANVTVLQGVWWDCRWPEFERAPVTAFGGRRSEDGKTTTFNLKRSEFAHGETILIAVYDTASDDGTEVMRLTGFAFAKSDPGDCVGIQKP